MTSDFWLDRIPLWGVLLLTIAVVFLSIKIGALLGHRRRQQPEHETDASLGTISGAMLGLLAFILAFTFGLAANLMQDRRDLLLHEVNAIGTVYLRAGLVSEPHRSELHRLLREYVDIRAELAAENLAGQPEKLQEALARSEALQDQMWSQAVAVAEANHNSPIDALFISSLNDMIDLQTSRLTAASYHIPDTFWDVLYVITVLSMMTVGYQAGLSGKSSFRVGLILAFTFSAVVFLVADLDRVVEGRLRVNQQPMLDLQRKMHAPETPAEPRQAFRESAWRFAMHADTSMTAPRYPTGPAMQRASQPPDDGGMRYRGVEFPWRDPATF